MEVNGNHMNAFPGLEVASPGYNANDKYLDERVRDSTLEATPTTGGHQEKHKFMTAEVAEDAHVSQPAPSSPKRKWSRKKKLYIAGAVVLVIVAVVVGVVCGMISKKEVAVPDPEESTAGSAPTSTNNSSSSVSMVGNANVSSGYFKPAAATWGHPHMDLFVANEKGTPLWLSRPATALSISDWNLTAASTSGAIGPFISLGGQVHDTTEPLAAISRGGNNIDVFSVGVNDSYIRQKYWENNAWAPEKSWYSADQNSISRKKLSSMPGIGSWAEDRLDVFIIDQGRELWQLGWAGTGWYDWVAFGGNFLFDFAPTISSWGRGRYDLFAVRTNNSLAYKYYEGIWSPSEIGDFYDLGGYLTSKPAVVAPVAGRMLLFARGGDAGLWSLDFDGKWGNWTRLGTDQDHIKGDPSAVVLGDTVHVFAWNDDGSLVSTSWNWKTGKPQDTTFTNLANSLVGAPVAVTDNINIEVFAYIQGSRIGWKYLSDGQWNPSTQTMTGLGQY